MDEAKKIKTRILKYGEYPRNNDIVTAHVELEKLNAQVYMYVYEKDNHSADDDTMMIVIKIGDVYFAADSYRRYMTCKDDFLAKATIFANNFITNIRSDVQGEKHIPLMYIRIFEELGLDTAPLYRAREKAEERREEARRLEEQQQEQRKRGAAQEEEQRLAQVKKDFLEEKDIDAEDFLSLCKQEGIEINIRTIGTIRKSISKLDINGTVNYWKSSKKRCPDFTGCRNAIGHLRNIIRENTPV